MFGRKPRWLRCGDSLINLEKVDCFETDPQERKEGRNAVIAFFNGFEICTLRGVTLDDIHYFLKHGRPRTRKALKLLRRTQNVK